MAATLKVHIWQTQNVYVGLVQGLYKPYQSMASISHISHYQMLPRPMEPLTSLESIADVPDWQVLEQANRSSSDFLSFFLSLSVSQASTIAVEAIYFTDHASSPCLPFPPLFSLTIPGRKKTAGTSHKKAFLMKTNACRDGTLKNQPNKVGTTPQHMHPHHPHILCHFANYAQQKSPYILTKGTQYSPLLTPQAST